MGKQIKVLIFIFLAADIFLALWLLLYGKNVAILNPHGIIAYQERNLMYFALILMFILMIPLFIFTIFVAWRYREGNTNAAYTPEWNHSTKLQILWWGVPFLFVCLLSTVTWIYTHKLEPQKKLFVSDMSNNKKPITIEVVALRWKWLFIYPDQGIATINFVEFPEKVPITFALTADEATMNSFWIPNIGGQLYAMTGMVNRLNLIAGETGEFPGSNAEISGRGFAGMRFVAKSVSWNEFYSWVANVQQSQKVLTMDEYNKLLKPSEDNPPMYYSSTSNSLFNTIVNKYMPQKISGVPIESEAMHGMKMIGK